MTWFELADEPRHARVGRSATLKAWSMDALLSDQSALGRGHGAEVDDGVGARECGGQGCWASACTTQSQGGSEPFAQ